MQDHAFCVGCGNFSGVLLGGRYLPRAGAETGRDVIDCHGGFTRVLADMGRVAMGRRRVKVAANEQRPARRDPFRDVVSGRGLIVS